MSLNQLGRVIVAVASFCILLQGTAMAKRPREREKKPAKIVQHSVLFVPKLHAGVLTGESADVADYNNRGLSNTLVYGLGLGLQTHLDPTWALGFHVAVSWKNLTAFNTSKSITGMSFTGSCSYYLTPHKKYTPLAHLESGLIVMDERLFDLGTHPLLKAGMGIRGFTASGTTSHFLLYYELIFSDARRIGATGRPDTYDISYIGFEIAFGIGISNADGG